VAEVSWEAEGSKDCPVSMLLLISIIVLTTPAAKPTSNAKPTNIHVEASPQQVEESRWLPILGLKFVYGLSMVFARLLSL
jgi:hypothetical protein